MARLRSATPARAFSLSSTPFTTQIERRVLSFIRDRQVLRGEERLLVGVSGGADSTALLVILSRLRSDLDVVMAAAHYDHGLRGPEEAAADLAYVQELAETALAPLVWGRGDVMRRARRVRESVEEAARRMRYAFLAREAKAVDASLVLLGHTLDDQAESILLHLIRGSGLDGLAAMRPRASWPFGRGPDVGRPLLACRRKETERYCREAGLWAREDPTNELLIPTRNRVRHQLLPLLRALNPRAEEALARLADAVALDADYLQAAADEAWRRLAQVEDEAVRFTRGDLASIPAALTVRLVRLAVAELLGSSADLEAVHIVGLLSSLRRGRGRISLPHGLTAVTDARFVSISKGDIGTSPGILETSLTVPGRGEAGPWGFEAEVVAPPAQPRSADPLQVFLDADAAGGPLLVRSRRRGDRLRPLGLGGEKKVQDILVDAKVPASERDSVPIVCCDWGIVWVVGHCIDERAALRPSGRRALRLRFARTKSPH